MIENIIDGALGDMIDAATDIALNAIEAQADEPDLQLPVAGLRKTGDQVFVETLADLERAIGPFISSSGRNS